MVRLTTLHVFLISLGISAILISIGVIAADPGFLGNAVIISVFIILVPFFLREYKRYRELKEMEERFPFFLRDLIESIRAGLPLHQAIIAASKIHYGSLSHEIKKMTNQLSWGITLDKVLDQFAERVKSSKRMSSAIKIIRESYLAGGDVISTMDSLTDSHLILIESEKEKSSMLNQYVLLMYIISIVFITIVIAINKLMLPIFKLSGETAEFGLANPCAECRGLECGICGLYETAAKILFVPDPASVAGYYTGVFFFMCLVQAIFSGLVAGEISEGKLIAGIRHSLILAAIVFGTFSILVKIGLIGV